LEAGNKLMEAAMAEYRNEDLRLSCVTKFSILKINEKRLIDGSITNNSFPDISKSWE